MKRLLHVTAILTLLTPLLLGCGSKYDGEGKRAHEAWRASLKDSVDSLHRVMDATSLQIERNHARVDSLLQKFERVDNPRHVEGFTILKGYASRYPLTGTGIVARLLENEQIELVAALSGASFSAISVSDGTQSVASQRVPYDQALNYRQGGLTTVAFSGAQADSVAAFVAQHASRNLTLSYLEKGTVRSVALTPAQKQMIATTWELVDLHRQTQHLERLMPLTQEKIKIIESKQQ